MDDRVKEEIEKFIRRYYDAELIISEKSNTFKMKSGGTYGDCLANSIIRYLECGTNPNELVKRDCFTYITKAYAYGLVTSSDKILALLDEERKKNAELLKDLSICLANYAALERKYNQLTGNLEKPIRPHGNP